MFGSSILDVVLGVVFTFLAVSIAASAVTETIASALRLRQSTLLEGIKAMVNDPGFEGLARALYSHALVNPLGSECGQRILPSYIAARGFAIALRDILQSRDPLAPIGEVIGKIEDTQLRQALLSLLATANHQIPAFEAELATWFDNAMLRVSGWYRRRTQLIAFAVGLSIAGLLNADVVHVTQVLWQRPALSAVLAAGAHGADVQSVLHQLDQSTLVGWAGWSSDPRRHGVGLAMMLVGWAIVAAASLFGAPFWFDTLQRVIWIRTAASPESESLARPGALPHRSASRLDPATG